MIHNNRKSQDKIPKPLLDAKEVLLKIAQTGNKKLISDRIYKGEKTEKGQKLFLVRNKLRSLYYQKCAYCESKEFKPEVEHYRPKGDVTGDSTHLGYYWLCYEWSNLLPACHNCNTGTGKMNQFPIVGKRVYSPSFNTTDELDLEKCKAYNSPLIDEQPLLFHPEIDHPEKFFKFDQLGNIEGIGNRGINTVKICELDRQQLITNRKKVADEIVRSIDRSFYHLTIHPADRKGFKAQIEDIFISLDNSCQPQHEYSLLHRYIRDHFDELITKQLPQLQKVVMFAYRNYRKKNPIS